MSGPSPQLPLGIALPESATLGDYVAGDNGEVLAALQNADAGDRLYLHGPPASGKSHLLQGACRAAPGPASYLPLAELHAHPPALLEGFEAVDRVCLDEVDAIAGNRPWEEALVGLLDRLRARGVTVIAAGPRPPDDLSPLLPDLASRLGWGAVYALRPLDDAGKSRLLRRRAAARGLEMTGEVARFVIRRAPRDVRELLALLDRLDRASLAEKRRLTVPFVKAVLEA